MNYSLCRTRDGYMLTPERLPPPVAAREAHPHVMDIGTIIGAQLPVALGAHCMYEVAKSRFVFIGFRHDGYVDLDALAHTMTRS